MEKKALSLTELGQLVESKDNELMKLKSKLEYVLRSSNVPMTGARLSSSITQRKHRGAQAVHEPSLNHELISTRSHLKTYKEKNEVLEEKIETTTATLNTAVSDLTTAQSLVENLRHESKKAEKKYQMGSDRDNNRLKKAEFERDQGN